MADSTLLRATREAFFTVVRSRTTSFLLAVTGLGLGVLALFTEPLAGAVLLSSLVLAFVAVGLYALILRDRFGGLYEVLDDESLWDLRDSAGTDALLTRTRTLRFLQDGVFAIRDYAWGNGDVLADYSCDPGYPADYYSAGGRHNVVISLRDTKRRGDVDTYTIKRRTTDMFLGSSEWVSTETLQTTRRLTLTVLFPVSRIPVEAWLDRSSRPEHARKRLRAEVHSGGRQKLSVTLHDPPLRETFTIWWRW